MASELSALHVFVYGGEYNAPFEGDRDTEALHTPASLGAELIRSPEWKGYMITDIAERDPDFNLVDGRAVYSPLSDRALNPTGQRGLAVGDVIVGINGESVMYVPDMHMLLRGMEGRSVRLEVLRLKSGGAGYDTTDEIPVETLVTVPINPYAASELAYNAWEWKTRQKALAMAAEAGFSVGYIHMKNMGRDDEDAFARDFFPNYDKEALILDLRHNRGGNIDSWILDTLQRKAWMFWGDRTGVRTGGLDWDNQFAFRGHLVVLIDEHTASDGEGVSRGISELGLGRLVGTRTWGGGIWLSSDNRLVDGGIATAPEMGTFNSKFGWGGGIEQQGVKPDIEVDNNPRTTFDGKDTQLERAIAELKTWLKEEPTVNFQSPGPKPDMSLQTDDCPA
jgi:tricorn protease